MDDCTIPCKALLVTLSGKNIEPRKDNTGQAFFYFPPRIVQNREKHFYSTLSLVAEIGGYVGLLLGVSLFHLARGFNQLLEEKISKMRGIKKIEEKIFTVHARDVY